jgi:hypothetical protein
VAKHRPRKVLGRVPFTREEFNERPRPGLQCLIPTKREEAVSSEDLVNHPKHYAERVPGIECIDVTKHFDFVIGNCIKYLWRCGHKKSSTRLEDLRKAAFYVNFAIQEEEKKVGKRNA